MSGSLRADIGKYEAEKKAKVKGHFWPHIRCLFCLASFLGCGRVKKFLETKKQ